MCVRHRAYGYVTSVDHTADAAVKRVAACAPQVMILDIGLPDMDGYELARRIRSMPIAEGTVFIALTGYGQSQDRQQSAAAGFAHHLVKPVDIQELLAVLGATYAA